MAPSEPTIIDIGKAKQALSQFSTLHQNMVGAAGAKGVGSLANCVDLYPATGPLIKGAGSNFAGYYNPRARAVYQCINDSINAVGTIVDLLTKTIAHYEQHETNTKGSADGTATAAGKG
jgi:hypothetical protein